MLFKILVIRVLSNYVRVVLKVEFFLFPTASHVLYFLILLVVSKIIEAVSMKAFKSVFRSHIVITFILSDKIIRGEI